MELLQAPIPRADPGAVSGGDVLAVNAGVNAFGFDLYREFRGDLGNLAFTPLSLFTALSMAFAGARGRTQEQIRAALRWSLPEERLHTALSAFTLRLARRLAAASWLKEDSPILAMANTIWADRQLSVAPGYLDTLARCYGTGVRRGDFSSKESAEAARTAMNDWVSEQTAGKVLDLVSQPPRSMSAFLLNALHFKARWESEFDPTSTRDCPFTLLDGHNVDVPMMCQEMPAGYSRGEDWQSVELHYGYCDWSMMIVVPDRGRFACFERTLSDTLFASIVLSVRSEQVLLSLPRFRCESGPDATGALQRLGVSDAFSRCEADFTGLSDAKPFFIDQVIHRAFVESNEQGTEAAAATAMAVAAGFVLPPPPVRLVIDRPFIYFIRDRRTGTILFMGRVMDPSRTS